MTKERTSSESWARSQWTLVAIVAAVVVSYIAITSVYLKGISDRSAESKAQARFVTCVRNWSDAYTRRADLLLGLSTERTDALDARIRAEDAFLDRLRTDPASFKAGLDRLHRAAGAYRRASAAYKQATKEHPVPASPEFVCSGGRSGIAPGHVADGAVTAPESASATLPTVPTSPRPSSPPAPSRVTATVTPPPRTRAGPTVTHVRTSTRTATATVTARPTATVTRPLIVLPSRVLCLLPICPTEKP